MWHAVPVEHLLLLLRADAVVFVEKVEERALGLLEGGISARLEISKVGEDSFLELFRVLDGSAKRLKTKGKASHDIGARDVEEIIPDLPLESLFVLCQRCTYHRTQET